MFKQIAMIGIAALSLSACGSQKTRTEVPLDPLVGPSSAPWISVAATSGDLPVRGLDEKLILTPSLPISEVIQAQLRQALQSEYTANLTVACEGMKADMRVKREDDVPSTAIFEVSMRCITNARGYITRNDMRAQPSAPVNAQTDYSKLLVSLVDSASKDMIEKVRADIATSKSNLR
ncbi:MULTISPECIES: hypothetical protein [Dyella]|uniref:Lipoprotein n=2 Tax=Dyella TaxID=231454 RepID=A0A4R0YXZ8_9GAMM|nr:MULTISPECIES: hypothetical protein [Dyella]TBR38928.1 hypothetical protein EYV96_01365 [Dyella terrae]TCI13481.1 hypothetical protein EZM97_09505 [Dyella soli]